MIKATGIIMVISAAMVLSVSSCGAKVASATADLLYVMKNHKISSVVWSPKGDNIAFVTVNENDFPTEADYYIVRRASIWTLSLPAQGKPAKPRHLTTTTRAQGIPAALFWLDNNRIGWAASHYSQRKHTFSFMQMGLSVCKPKSLISQSFNGVQNRYGMEGPFGGPDDVYYDAASRSIMFSGGVMPSGVYIKLLSLSTGKARKLFIPSADVTGWVTLCGSLRNPQKPIIYTAASIQRRGDVVWRSGSYSLHQDKIFVTSSERYLQFPRISPSGKMLAYLSILGKTGMSEIMLYNMESGKIRRLATLSSQWEAGFYPAMGCPFSWSPDGKKIAYADGDRIKIVKVSR